MIQQFFCKMFLYMACAVYYVAMPIKRDYIKGKFNDNFSNVKDFDDALEEFQKIIRIKP